MTTTAPANTLDVVREMLTETQQEINSIIAEREELRPPGTGRPQNTVRYVELGDRLQQARQRKETLNSAIIRVLEAGGEAGPRWHVYSEDNEHMGGLKYAEDAAALLALHGAGTIRGADGAVVWTEGAEDFSASESYDGVALVIAERTQNAR